MNAGAMEGIASCVIVESLLKNLVMLDNKSCAQLICRKLIKNCCKMLVGTPIYFFNDFVDVITERPISSTLHKVVPEINALSA